MRTINGNGIMLIKEMEGLRLRSYKDAVGVWTVGYGSTGDHVHPGMVISEKQAEWFLKSDLIRFEASVDNLVKSEISQNQFDALVCFAFNLGAAALKRSTLLKKVNVDPDDPTIRGEFLKYRFAGGKELAGLKKRRIKEADLYFEP